MGTASGLIFRCTRRHAAETTREQCAGFRSMPREGEGKRKRLQEDCMPVACENCKEWPGIFKRLDEAQAFSSDAPSPESPPVQEVSPRRKYPMGVCPDCGPEAGEKRILCRGLCVTHYWRHRTAGDLDEQHPVRPREKKPPMPRRKKAAAAQPEEPPVPDNQTGFEIRGGGGFMDIVLSIRVSAEDLETVMRAVEQRMTITRRSV